MAAIKSRCGPDQPNRQPTPEKTRAFALDVVQTLRGSGFTALWAGGCVRDFLRGQVPHDYDVATDALPDQVQQLFRRTISVGAQFGVIEVLGPRPLHVQVATFRSDGSYSDGRHPDSVRFGTPKEDALRRDFTINGLFYDPISEKVLDFVGGQADLRAKVVRAIGDPRARILEDKLRILRAIRFVSTLQFDLDPSTRNAVAEFVDSLNQVSVERITEELKKMLTPTTRDTAVLLMDELGLLKKILPDFDTSSSQAHKYPLVAALPSDTVSFCVVWTALLLELARKAGGNGLGNRDIQKLSSRFRLSNAELSTIGFFVDNLPLLRYADQLEWWRLKPILAHVSINDLLSLLRAACQAYGWQQNGLRYCQQQLSQWTQNQLEPAPLVTGDDLIRLGVPQGPQFKILLDAIRREQLNETINTREEALLLLKEKVAAINYDRQNDS